MTLSLFIITSVGSIVLIQVYHYSNQLTKRIRAEARVGPHNNDIISIFYGTLLGDSHAEWRSKGRGTRISISQEGNHREYLL